MASFRAHDYQPRAAWIRCQWDSDFTCAKLVDRGSAEIRRGWATLPQCLYDLWTALFNQRGWVFCAAPICAVQPADVGLAAKSSPINFRAVSYFIAPIFLRCSVHWFGVAPVCGKCQSSLFFRSFRFRYWGVRCHCYDVLNSSGTKPDTHLSNRVLWCADH